MKYLAILPVLLSFHLTFGQCPDKQKVIDKINEVSAFDNDKIIKELTTLQNTCIRCKLDNDSTYAKILHIIGRTYWYAGKLDEGIEFTSKAILINSQKKPTSKEANLINSYYNLGRIFLEKNDYKSSIKSYEKGISHGKNFAEKWQLVSQSYVQIANVYFFNGDYQNSIKNADLGINYATKANNSIWIINNSVEKIQSLISLAQLDKAEQTLVPILILAKKETDKTFEANIYSIYALLKLKKKEYQPAINLYKKAFLSYKKLVTPFGLGDKYGCSQALINLGVTYTAKDDYSNALKYYNEALEYANDPSTKSLVFDNIGEVYKKKQDFPNALKYLTKSLLTAPINYADSSIIKNPTKISLKLSPSKTYLLSTIKDKADTWLDFYKFDKNKTHLKNALNTYKTADLMIDIMRWEHTGEQSKLFWRNKTREIYENAIETCFLLKQPEDAFYFFEKSRAVLLNDKLKELGAKQLLSTADRKQETKLQDEVSELRKLVAEKNTTKNQRNLLTAETKQINFIRQLEIQNHAYYAYKYDTTSLKIADVRKNILAKNQSLVTYFTGNNATYAFILSHSDAKIHQFLEKYFLKLSNDLLRMMANEDSLNRNFLNYLALSNQFYKNFVQPLQLPKGRVVISPDGTIIPFSALSYSAIKPEWLLKDYIFSYTYSAKFLSNEKTNTAFQTKSFLGVAPVNFANNQTKLTHSDVSLKRIANHFSSPQLLLNNEASKHSFISQIADYQVIQLYTHAIANDTLAQLYLSDSTLKASELTSNDLLPTQLIVLSACQTGIGKDAKGEGIFSLARSFATLGISSMLTTLWQVDNEAIYQLTELFYKYLDEGLPKDEALNKAQIAYLSINQSSRGLPNYWAGYILIGNASAISHSKLQYYIIGAVFLLLISLMVWYKIRRK